MSLALDRRLELRRNQTPAEARLWCLLRNRQPLGHRFRRQHPFGPYILDFYCPSARLAIELDGEVRFLTEDRSYDCRRDLWLRGRGVRVLRFLNTELQFEPDAVLEEILRNLGRVPGGAL